MNEKLQRIASTAEAWRTSCTAVYRAGEALIADGKAAHVVLCEFEDDISTRQRGFFHAAVLPQIAEQVRVNGERYVPLVWKEFFRTMFLPDRWVSMKVPRWDAKLGRIVVPKRATPHRERSSTEDLGIKGYSEHIDKVIAHAATEFGVVFVFRGDEREAVRYQPPRRKAAAAKVQDEAVPA